MNQTRNAGSDFVLRLYYFIHAYYYSCDSNPLSQNRESIFWRQQFWMHFTVSVIISFLQHDQINFCEPLFVKLNVVRNSTNNRVALSSYILKSVVKGHVKEALAWFVEISDSHPPVAGHVQVIQVLALLRKHNNLICWDIISYSGIYLQGKYAWQRQYVPPRIFFVNR